MKIGKRKLLALILVLIGILLLIVVIMSYNKKEIDEVEAQNIVLKDIGVKLSSVKHLTTKQEVEDGENIYEIKLIIDNTEYEYEISATNGTILKREKEQVKGVSNSESKTIPLEKALEIVCNDAKVKKEEIEITSEQRETENGILIYEIEFYDNENKYEYEIHSETGDVIKKEIEPRKKIENANQIGEEKAFEIALTHAKVVDVTMKKIKLDYEHGTMIYEIEFYKNGIEYEYEIDANTGTILKYSQDRD